jgi:transcriptional regulator of acetoin/glycerol metabolism
MRIGSATADDNRRSDWNRSDYQTALHAAISGFELEFIRHHLAKNQGNISKTAAAIGLSRVALHKKIKQHAIRL